jgi:iron uptake system component EfeO
MRPTLFSAGIVLSAIAVTACSSDGGGDSSTGTSYEKQVVTGMHASIAVELEDLHAAAVELQKAAPDGAWDGTADAESITSMKKAWQKCRVAYEHVEGAVAPLFEGIDASIDARYDDFLTSLGGKGDDDLFDGEGVTGMHAIERVLFSDATPSLVIDFEKTLPGYVPAAFPATSDEAAEFKSGLLQKLIDDTAQVQTEWKPAAIDVGTAFQGLISLMNEQREKVNKAASGEEESRYSQMTLFDLRNNLEGTQKVYEIFEPWVLSKKSDDANKDGATIDASVLDGMKTLETLYAGYDGDAVPPPPATWSSDAPTAKDLDSPFGKLYSEVLASVDPADSASVVSQMNDIADLLGFPAFKEEE